MIIEGRLGELSKEMGLNLIGPGNLLDSKWNGLGSS